MSKQRASEETTMAFIKAVYPECTELAMTMLNEEQCLKDATAIILAYRIAAQQIIAADRKPQQCLFSRSLWCVDLDCDNCDVPEGERRLKEQGWMGDVGGIGCDPDVE